MLDAPFLLAFSAGMVAAFNPCGFAMLPAYIGSFLGVDSASGQARQAPVGRAILVAATVGAGFVVVFGALGIVISTVSRRIQDFLPWVTVVVGIGLVVLGVALVLGRSVKLPVVGAGHGAGGQGLRSMFVFGISYALVSLSCTMPVFLAAVAGSFREGNLVAGVLVFLTYAAGMSTVLAVLTVAVALAQDSVVRRLRSARQWVGRASGALLVVAGAYVTWYGYFEIRILRGDDVAAGPVDWVTDWSGRATEALSGRTTAAAAAIVGLILLAVLVWSRLGQDGTEVPESPVTAPPGATRAGPGHGSPGDDEAPLSAGPTDESRH